MPQKKTRVGIIFGGRSAEHEVSLQSARNVYNALDKTRYEPVLIGITKEGNWQFHASLHLSSGDNTSLPENQKQDPRKIALVPQQAEMNQLDVIFPVLHGPYGEDGTIQGLLKLTGIPFVGSDVLGSAIGMDKDVMKRLLQQANIPIGKYLVVKKPEISSLSFESITKTLGSVLFIKPANLGSSVGVQKVHDVSEFQKATNEAFQYGDKIIIEQAMKVREIECAVLGNDDPKASLPGEIIPHHEFYSYEAKYLDPEGAETVIPANLSETHAKEIQDLAIKTFQTLCCQGMARVDFFLTEQNEIFVNEINTIPGFTNISMYPKLWEASGISYSELINRLIDLAIEKHKFSAAFKTTYL